MTTPLSLYLADEAETDRLARMIAPALQAGDVLLLEGGIGAGKTQFCRALIRARLGREEDVPSPTFTLVQTYEGDPDIWHADLYRLTHPDEVMELGLEAAFADAICLVEWPDRLGSDAPKSALRLQFSPQGEGRRVDLHLGRLERLGASLAATFPDARDQACAAMLARAGWDGAQRQALAGDASARQYFRLSQRGQSRILMDNPPGIPDDPRAFARIATHLRGLGLSAPEILAQDLEAGFLLLEDLGDGVLTRLLQDDPGREGEFYRLATEVLLHLQAHPAPEGLPNLEAADWARAAMLAVEFYAAGMTGAGADPLPLQDALTRALLRHADGPRVLILRDYHAENLMWLPERQGLARLGLLDFQLAQMGQPGYDLVSLLQDARRDVSPATEAAMVALFAQARGEDAAGFAASYAVLGAQRALRILGIFARLCLVEGKAQYLGLIPRVWGQLQRNLAHPALAEVKVACDALLPAPDAAGLKRMADRCSPCP